MTDNVAHGDLLAYAVHDFLKIEYEPAVVKGSDSYIEQLYRLEALNNLHLFTSVVEDPSTKDSFKKFLSDEQLQSWDLISDWLNASYEPPSMRGVARELIPSDAFTLTGLRQATVDYSRGRFDKQSAYQFWLSELYVLEFVPTLDRLFKAGSRGQFVRDNALNLTISQATADRLVSHASCFPQPQPTPRLQPRIRKDPCPWLKLSTDLEDKPHFLWDTVLKKTVVTGEVAGAIEYACISHTWGRWKLATQISIQGALWLVPQNSLFEVENLPWYLDLASYTLGTRYMWFDLLCVPQNDSRPEMQVLTHQEIGRQAAIFRNAKASAAWLNYIDDWGPERAVLEYSSYLYLALVCPPEAYDVKRLLLESRPKAEQSLQIAGGESMTEPSNWFSSLWTLQEAHLRPDMLFLDKNWQPLSDSAGTVYRLETIRLASEALQFLNHRCKDLRQNLGTSSAAWPQAYQDLNQYPGPDFIAKLPYGARQLYFASLSSSTIPKSGATRSHILIEANTRQCTKRRAEAIMSVLGATEWYSKTSSGTSDLKEGDLVLGMFPLSFLKEVQASLGPAFFDSVMVMKPELYLTGERTGSMLPFTSFDETMRHGRSGVMPPALALRDNTYHSSIASWELNISGHYRIRKAAILATTMLGTPIPDVPFRMIWADYSHATSETELSIQAWVKKQPADQITFAVHTSRHRGILLRAWKPFTAPMRLVRTGQFILVDPPMTNGGFAQALRPSIVDLPVEWVPARNVDWIVL